MKILSNSKYDELINKIGFLELKLSAAKNTNSILQSEYDEFKNQIGERITFLEKNYKALDEKHNKLIKEYGVYQTAVNAEREEKDLIIKNLKEQLQQPKKRARKEKVKEEKGE